MAPSRPASEAGFTLLELSLAVALSTAFLMAFFFGYQTYLQSVNMAVANLRGPAEVAEMVEQMTRELDQAIAVNSWGPTSIDFTIPNNVRIRYALVVSDPAASQDVYVERWDSLSNASASIGPRRVIANAHPYASIMFDARNNVIQPPTLVPLFDYPAESPGPGGQTMQVGIHVVIQPQEDAMVRYVRGNAMPRVFR